MISFRKGTIVFEAAMNARRVNAYAGSRLDCTNEVTNRCKDVMMVPWVAYARVSCFYLRPRILRVYIF